MSRIHRLYSTVATLVGAVVFLIALAQVYLAQFGILDGLLILLGVAASWLRISIKPSGHISLAPLVIFLSLLLSGAPVALLVATIAALVGAKVFARLSLRGSLVEVGERAAATWMAVFSNSWVQKITSDASVQPGLLGFTAAVLVFGVVSVMLAALRSKLEEGLGVRSFVLGAGKFAFFHVLFLGSAALVLRYLYVRVGFLALPLASIALAELYYPAKLLSEQKDVLYASLAVIAQAIDLKDVYTGRHARQVAEIAVRIARTMGLPEVEVGKIRIASLLHDIGKVGISGDIIRKPSALAPDELSAMQRHPVIGAEIMEPVELLAEASELVRHHHEHFDGSGYPDGLRGEKIPVGSRIVLVADALNAMTTDRPYRRGRGKQEALKVLKEHSGVQFDPVVIGALEDIIDLI